MKTLHLYLTRQVVAALMLTVLVFTFVLMLGTVLKEVIGLLVSGQTGMLTVAKAVALLVPFVMVYSLPMGLLTATLLVFGRLSADQELTAVRAGGISLVSLITPVLLLSVGLSILSAAVNMEFAPRCRVAYLDLLVKSGTSRLSSLLPEKTYIRDLDTNAIVYVSKVRGTNLEDVFIYRLDQGKVVDYVRADTGNFWFDPIGHRLGGQLFNYNQILFIDGRETPHWFGSGSGRFEFTNETRQSSRRIDTADMTFGQLREEVRDLEARMGLAPDLSKLRTDEQRDKLRRAAVPKKKDLLLPLQVQMHRQVAFSFACIGFTLVGIPLGIRAHRRETTFGVAIALMLVLVYYTFLIVGQSMDTRPEMLPHLIVWLPNFIFQAVGIVLLWRANRGI